MAEQLKPSGIGGQAVMEGVMMRNRAKYAVAVRKPDGQTVLNVKEYHSVSEKLPFLGWPFIRGAVSLIESMIVGMGTLMYSANFADEEAPAKDDSPAQEKTTEAPKAEEESKPFMTPAMIGATVVLSLAITIALFMLLPFAVTSLFERVTGVESA
ncbi:MAG: DUF1385 domain-containing protein, partial [Lachnospiraceae bacterium]|nr:DUF1385 domain-containing protein [Lachnospiraceae bacterium]